MRNDLDIIFPNYYAVAAYPPGASFGPRTMRDFEFVWMIQGDAVYRRGARVISAPEGSIVLCRPGAIDSFDWDTKQRTRHGFFHFQIRKSPEEWGSHDSWPDVRPSRGDDLLAGLFRHLLAPGSQIDSLQTHLAVELLLTAFLSGETRADAIAPDPWPDAVTRVWEYIQDRLGEASDTPISLAELSSAACVSPEHLCRIFKEATGRSPVETVRLARLDNACTLLTRSNYSVGEVSALCGFANPFHFSRLFKSVYGRSPTQVREAVRSGENTPTPRLVRSRPSS